MVRPFVDLKFPNKMLSKIESYFGTKRISHAQIFAKNLMSTRLALLFVLSISFGISESLAQTTVVVDDVTLRLAQSDQISLNMKLYPNPSQEKIMLEISGATETHQIMIFDLSGKLIQSIKPTQTGLVHKLNISTLPAGTYVLRLNTEKGSISRKFSKI